MLAHTTTLFHNLLCTVRDNKCQNLIDYLESSNEPKSESDMNLHHTFNKMNKFINTPKLLFIICKVTSYHFLSRVLPWPQSNLVLLRFLEWYSKMCSSFIIVTGKLWGMLFQVLCHCGIIPTATWPELTHLWLAWNRNKDHLFSTWVCRHTWRNGHNYSLKTKSSQGL